MKSKKLIITLLMMTSILIVLMPNSNAVLNSNGSTAAVGNSTNWIKWIRQLECLGGGLGLAETLNDDMTSSSGSNNIDVHLQRNTEYGAMVILAVSSYGNPNTIASGATTTGNETGIVYIGTKNDGEATASAADSSSNIYDGINVKYYDRYKENDRTYYKLGDATLETHGWQSGTGSSGLDNLDGYARGYSSIFSYDAAWINHHTRGSTARAAVVCGEGI